jgi:lambda family phage portal protein
MDARLNWVDRLVLFLAPKWGAQRVRARVLARHFEAATSGRRTSGWSRKHTDANAAASGGQIANLRAQARDLVRNNPWAARGINRIARNTVGWGIKPTAAGRNAERLMDLWAQWGETTQCDAAGRHNFYGLQELVMRTIVESGEVLIRRRRRRPDDGLAIPLQLQVLEPDYLDTDKDGIKGEAGGPILQGVEFDAIGRRAAYWLFDQHPGSSTGSLYSPVSHRVPADGVLHVYHQARPGQVRGTSWFASVDVRLHDFDEFEDATLMKQKIAACMAAFVTDLDGTGPSLGRADTAHDGEPLDMIQPGMIMNLPVGKQVTVSNPPQASDHSSFSMASLRGIAAGLGTTYEDLTGDYSQVNFSSARMARLAHMADVHSWRWHMLVPQFLAPAWAWMLDAAVLVADDVEQLPAEWTPPATPMIDPANEGMAISRLVRTGAMTLDEMVREQGYDPKKFWIEYAAGLKRLDDLGIILDSDARKTTAGGQLQQAPAQPAKAIGGEKPSESDDGAPDAEAKPKAKPAVNERPDTEPAEDEPVKDKTDDKGQAKPGEAKVFAYQQPFMKAKEIRERIGLPGDVSDGDLFALEFIAKHGGSSDDPDGSDGAPEE